MKKKKLQTAEIVLQGAHEILAERISDEPKYRIWLRDYMVKHAQYVSVVKDEEKTKSGPMKCITILQNQLANGAAPCLSNESW